MPTLIITTSEEPVYQPGSIEPRNAPEVSLRLKLEPQTKKPPGGRLFLCQSLNISVWSIACAAAPYAGRLSSARLGAHRRQPPRPSPQPGCPPCLARSVHAPDRAARPPPVR